MNADLKRLQAMNDDELIEAFHRANLNHKNAPDSAKDGAFQLKVAIEHAMHAKRGLGVLLKAYHAKYPE